MINRRNVIKLTIGASMVHLTKAIAVDSALGSEASPILQFGAIADPQYADRAARGSRFYRNSLLKLDTAVAKMNVEPLDFVVTLGDVIDKDLRSFDKIMPIYKKLKHPSEYVLGNHDFDVDEGDKEKVLAKLGLTKSYFSKESKGVRFIYLDGTMESQFRYVKDSEEYLSSTQKASKLKKMGRRHIYSYNAGLGAKQLAWLKTELKMAEVANQPVILFNHFPVFPLSGGHNLWDDKELLAILEDSNQVLAYFNGHDHKGSYHNHKGIHFVNLKGMVETGNKSAYSIVRVYADRLELEGYGTEPSRELAKS